MPEYGQPTGERGSTDDGALEHQGPVVRDKRRIDPETGQLRNPAPGGGSTPDLSSPGVPDAAVAADNSDSELASDAQLAAERLADLQRVQAEYANYRRRVERDRDVARDQAVGSVLESLLPVLDDLHLARQHGDLDGGPFAAIADKLEAVLARFGLERFGAVGEPFDPSVHEAIQQLESVDHPAGVIMAEVQPGYSLGDRLIRAAMVVVSKGPPQAS